MDGFAPTSTWGPFLESLPPADRAHAMQLGAEDISVVAAALRFGQGAGPATPIPMILFCPVCHRQHIDQPEPELGWTNPPHKSHTCVHCRAEGRMVIWRPAMVPTTGVASIERLGSDDTWSIEQARSQK